jgi:hypothetical protein
MAETTGTGLPPTVEASDHADVAVLLKAAAALWEGADIDGALRWFARAAETASDVGDDRRALELARAIADLKEQHTAKSPSRPPPTPPSKSPPKPPPRRTIATTPREAPGASPAKPNEEASTPGMRVSVKTSVRDPDLLIVRVLRNGQVPPSGWGEAILAPTGRGFDLPSPRE